METKTYTYKEIIELMKQMSAIYDLVRLVDPDECEELEIDSKGLIKPIKKCFKVWSTGSRCANCSSYKACHSKTRNEKIEYFEGNTYHILSYPVEIKNDDGIITSCVMECITVSKQTEAEKARYSNHIISNNYGTSRDALTGLLDSEGFFEEGRKALNKDDYNWYLVVYNITNFKVINDIFSREKGNEILIKIAELIRKRLKADEICARLRADRFAILIHKENFNDDFLLPELNSLGLLDNNLYSLNLQAGIYEVDDKNMSISSMIDRCLIVLSSLKEHHFSQFAIFDEDMLEDMKKEQEIISNCEKAIANKEFKMYLQPQVLKNGKVIGAEALARWQKEDGNIIMPASFIPVMEKNSFIVKLDTYIWEEAIKQLAKWKDTNKKDLSISMNISPKDFFYIDVYEYFENLINKYEVDKKKLRLEITESIMMNDENRQLANIKKLHDAGYVIAIDDFGKGYSSLSLLKDINADSLKIDKDFLNEIEINHKSESILKSLIDMSNNLNMKVITEGVENKQQLDKLANLGCNYFQGFYFAKPMPIKDFELYVDNN